MVGRVTNQTLMQTAQSNLQAKLAEIARLQDQTSTQKKFTRPSEDPSASAQVLQLQSSRRAAEQYGRNATDGNGWLATVDSTLTTTTDLLLRVRDLTVRGANDGSMSPAAKEAMAIELENLRDELLKQSNATYLGRTVFAGTSDAGVAFRPDYSFTGIAGSEVRRRVDSDTTVRVDADGASVYGEGPGSVFALVDTIAADLRTGTVNVGTHLAAIDVRMDAVINVQAEVGARHAQLLRAQEAIVDQLGSLEALRASIEDVDLGQVILDLRMQEVNYQAALAVSARVLQPTLMDFLA